MQRHIKIALILLFITLPFFIFGLLRSQKQIYVMSRGNYFFEKTRSSLDIKEIVLTFDKNRQITILLQDGLWRIKEADDYYAALPKINSLIQLIRGMVVYRADKLLPNDTEKYMSSSIKIESKTDSKIVDSAIIAPKTSKNKYHYAMLNNQPYLYQITGNVSLSPIVMDWIHTPILHIDYTQIKKINVGDFNAFRNTSTKELRNTDTNKDASYLYAFINHFHYLVAEAIKHTTHFNLQKYPQHKRYEITLFNGLIYIIQVYSDGQEYWLSVHLNKEKLIGGDVSNFLKENNMFYDGWYFKINNTVGEQLFSFVF